MSNIDPDVQAHMQQAAQMEAQRQRERLGINSAAEAGVFSPAEPPELKLVRERDAWMAEQFARANRPQDFTAIPTSPDDGPEHSGPATTPRVMAADWDAPLQEDLGGAPIPAAVTDDEKARLSMQAEMTQADADRGMQAALVDANAEMARPAMLRGVMADPASIGIESPPAE